MPALLLVTLVAIAGCGSEAPPAGERRLTVYAAASLAEVFPQIDPSARYSFAGSDELAAQLREGAQADVYAAANAEYPRQLHRAGIVEKPVVFAANRLVLIVPKRNPAQIARVDDVRRLGTKLVIAAEGVPVGGYTRALLETLDLSDALANVVSNEDDVKGVVAKVALGEADAGFVYATDAAAAGERVRTIELPSEAQPTIEYAIAVVATNGNKAAAEAFVRKVRSVEGRAVIEAAGFVVPDGQVRRSSSATSRFGATIR